MDLGFETIGNAALICHDQGPVLVTDPWIEGGAYFGSWGLSHEIPAEVGENIKQAPFVWISHGHPDHLSSKSLDLLAGKKILLADHVGGLIGKGLRERGFEVTVLKDRQWIQLSDRIRVLAIADYIQDSVLLVDIGGKLVVDMNDADDHGWGRFVKKIISGYPVSFLLHLSGYGDTDMINFFDEDGNRIAPRAAKKRPVGRSIANMTRRWGTRYFVPFSSMHNYRRADSIWASRYATELADYPRGFESKTSELLPAFIRYDLAKDRYEEIHPCQNPSEALDPKTFGDDWSEPLRAGDELRINNYFKAISHLTTFLDFINVRVGGKDHIVELAGKRFNRGLTFEAPRASLMTCVDYEIFDDLLIGNFMKTTLHGKFPAAPLYPDFNLYVTKYADNGRAKTKDELVLYFREYMKRAPLDYFRFQLRTRAVDRLRSWVEADSPAYNFLARSYHWLNAAR
jgi:hypothetical protein